MESIEVQTCKSCGEVKPLTPDFFYPHRLLKRGFGLHCKVCISNAQKAERARKAALKPPSSVPEGQKQCSCCREVKPADSAHFANHTCRRDGLRGECKECANRKGVDKRKPLWKRKQLSDKAGHKRCTVCKQDKPATAEFFVRASIKDYKDGLDTRCKVCLYAATNDRRRRQYATNEARRVFLGQKAKQYRLANPEVGRVARRRRRALKRGADGRYTALEWVKKMTDYDYKCHWCAQKIKGTPHADHLIPLYRGGANNIGNIVPACEACNCSRQAKLPHEWTNRLL